MSVSKQYISDSIAMLVKRGVSGVVISPGSRNAPLIRAFTQQKVKLFSIVDERSAAYFALGIALQTKLPAVLVCTSGTAALNYAPAVAEAFFMGVPLLLLTADRPLEAISQNENQTIYQQGMYANNCKAFYEFPDEQDADKAKYQPVEIINKAYAQCMQGFCGPVHINIPLREPLYKDLPQPSGGLRLSSLKPKKINKIDIALTTSTQKVLLVIGQYNKDEQLIELVKNLRTKGLLVYSEAIANIQGEAILSNGAFINDTLIEPDLVIFIGGQVVSKRMNQYLRSLTHTRFIQFSENTRLAEPFGQMCENYIIDAAIGLKELVACNFDKAFSKQWLGAFYKWKAMGEKDAKKLPFSDLQIAKELAQLFPPIASVFLGNSSIIRLFQLFQIDVDRVFANRGTSGIDGCLSTAVGIANTTRNQVYAILGDISFLYDSNGLFNPYLPPNLKIIVLNNGGGEIFRLINNPDTIPDILPYQQTKQQVNISKLCQAYGVDYLEADSKETFKDAFSCLKKETENVVLLEVKTHQQENDRVFKNFIKGIKENG